MDIDTRIRRRQHDDAGLVLDTEAISPVTHVADPVGHGRTFETLLDCLEPVLDGGLPPDTYVWGPPGAGKSAVVTALFAHLQPRSSDLSGIVHTASRAQPARERPQSFVYVDARNASSKFARYHAILDGVVDESVPTNGVRTETLLEQLQEALAPSYRRAVVAVDHVGEPDTVSLATLAEQLAPLSDAVAWLAVGRTRPADLDTTPPAKYIEIPAYESQTLVDIITSRAMSGLGPHAVAHSQSRAVADWARGNAHDALAALFVAADRAAERGRSTVTDDDITAATDSIPRPCVPLAQVLLLSPSRQRVLRALLAVDEMEGDSVGGTAAAIAADDTIDLSAGTVKRYLYELADDGIVERVRMDGSTTGRPPSRVEPRFPTRVFRRLYEECAPVET